jgi:transglutaminase-like putative cysteine protease
MSNLFGPPDTPENFFAGMAGPTGRLESLPGGDAGVKKTLKKMKEFIREGSKDPNIRQLAMSIIRKCRVKDALCETKAIFKWVQENLRWTRDVDGVETLQKPARTLSPEWRAGDCDDLTMALDSLLLSVGIGPTRLKVIAADAENPDSFSHVYMQVAMPTSHNQMAGLGDTGEVEWISLDPSPPGVGFGWEHATRFREGIFNV